MYGYVRRRSAAVAGEEQRVREAEEEKPTLYLHRCNEQLSRMPPAVAAYAGCNELQRGLMAADETHPFQKGSPLSKLNSYDVMNSYE